MAPRLVSSRPASADRAASELRKIRLGCTALQLDDEARRDLMERLAGVRSSTLLTDAGRTKVLRYLADHGAFKVGENRKSYPVGHPRMARALWISMHRKGVIQNGSDAALDAFVRRTTKGKATSARFLTDPEMGSKVVEALKAMSARAAEAAAETEARG